VTTTPRMLLPRRRRTDKKNEEELSFVRPTTTTTTTTTTPRERDSRKRPRQYYSKKKRRKAPLRRVRSLRSRGRRLWFCYSGVGAWRVFFSCRRPPRAPGTRRGRGRAVARSATAARRGKSSRR